MKLKFELSNEQRKYLGLIPVEKNWELIRFDGAKYNEVYYYFDGDIIRKEIMISENSYYEAELNEKTTENCTMILPKTTKGRIKKFNFTATQSFSPFGTYFKISNDGVLIANYTTQKTYYYENFKGNKIEATENFKQWLDKWIKESTEEDLKEIEEFKNANRKHCKFKEGDFFTFKISRREWGFGRILLDVSKLRKDEKFKKNKNYGLTNLMGKALIVKVYHKICDNISVDLKELVKCSALPSQAIMDNIFYYGEAIILGNLPLGMKEYDMLISVSNSISGNDKDIAYLQYGLIYKEISFSDYEKLIEELKIEMQTCRKEGIGFGIYANDLKECIKQNSNSPYWERENNYKICDLRNPLHIELKRKIFKAFGLNADKTYEENLKFMDTK